MMLIEIYRFKKNSMNDDGASPTVYNLLKRRFVESTESKKHMSECEIFQ